MAIRSRFKRRMASCHNPVEADSGAASAACSFLNIALSIIHLLQLYTRIDPFIDQIGNQVEYQGRSSDIDRNGFDHRKIRTFYRKNDFTANSRNTKKTFDQESTNQQCRKSCHDI